MKLIHSDDEDEESKDSEERERETLIRMLNVNEGKKTVPLSADMWSVSIIILCKDLPLLFDPEAKGRAFHLTRFLFGAVSQITNLMLQMVILLYVRKYVSNPAVASTQFNYKRFHSEIFEADSTFNQTAWENWGDQVGPYLELCQSSLSQVVFTGFIIFLWVTRMLEEARQCAKLSHTLLKMPGRPALATGAQMVQPVTETKKVKNKEDEETEEETEEVEEPTGEEVICFLTRGTRLAIYVLVLIPKCMVFVLLTKWGCDWLVATESFEDLILNAIALEFIINIDELVLENFFPEGTVEKVEGISFGYDEKEKSQDELDRELVCEYMWSAGYVLGVFIFTCTYINIFQQVLPGYNGDLTQHCIDPRIHAQFNPFCTISSVLNNTDCFPYGEDAEPPPGLVPSNMGIKPSRRHKKKPPVVAGPPQRRLAMEPFAVSDLVLRLEIDQVRTENAALERQLAELEQSLTDPERLRKHLKI